MAGDKRFFCKACNKTVKSEMKSQLIQHAATQIHKNNLTLKAKRSLSQAQLEDLVPGPKQASSEADLLARKICEMFLAANIPWQKLEHPKVRSFFQENCALTLPSEKVLRTKHLDACYQEAFEAMKAFLKDQPIWLCLDETTDACQRSVAHVLIGKLDGNQFHKPHLVNCAFFDANNGETTARLVNDTLKMYWPDFKAENLKILLSDAAPYMKLCGKNLQPFYPQLLHVTCLAHGLHRLCETIRELFPEVNDLIATVKKIFLKAKERKAIFKECWPDLAFPPDRSQVARTTNPVDKKFGQIWLLFLNRIFRLIEYF